MWTRVCAPLAAAAPPSQVAVEPDTPQRPPGAGGGAVTDLLLAALHLSSPSYRHGGARPRDNQSGSCAPGQGSGTLATERGRRRLLLVQPSSERTLEPMRRDCSSAEKQEPQLALLFVVPGSRLVSGDRDACLLAAAGVPVTRFGSRWRLDVTAPRALAGSAGLVRSTGESTGWRPSEAGRARGQPEPAYRMRRTPKRRLPALVVRG
jgi:hypothetical protein